MEGGTSIWRQQGDSTSPRADAIHAEARRLAQARRLEIALEEPEYFRIYGLDEDEWETRYATAVDERLIRESATEPDASHA